MCAARKKAEAKASKSFLPSLVSERREEGEPARPPVRTRHRWQQQQRQQQQQQRTAAEATKFYPLSFHTRNFFSLLKEEKEKGSSHFPPLPNLFFSFSLSLKSRIPNL